MKAAGKSAPTKADMYKDVADFAKKQRAQSKADGYATKDEYDAAYQKNLDNMTSEIPIISLYGTFKTSINCHYFAC